MAEDTYITIGGHSLLKQAVAMLEPERSILRTAFAEHTRRGIRDTMLQAYARLDRAISNSIEGSGLVPACSRGCSWCCHGVRVNVSTPEALAIAERISAQDELTSRVRTAAERRRTLNTDDLFQQGDPCPFLGHAGECLVYEARPIACRRHCCLDSTDCERAVKHPKLKLPVQQHTAANAAGVISALALAAALEDSELDYRTFELAAAVSAALQENAIERWLSGEPIFDQAVRPVDEIDRQIARTDLGQRRLAEPDSRKSIWKSSTKKKRPTPSRR